MQLEVKMLDNSSNNLFTSKQTINKGPSNIFRGFEDGKILRLMF